MNSNKKRIIKHLELIEKRYNIDLKNFKEQTLTARDNEMKNTSYNNYKKTLKDYIIDNKDINVKHLNLKNFRSWMGGINLMKLDAWLYNEMLHLNNLFELSGVEKLKMYINNEYNFKKIYNLIK